MEQDLEILKKILSELGFVDTYVEILIRKIVNDFNDSTLTEITPQFLYTVLAFELGRKNARDVSEYFEDFKKSGIYKTKIQRFLDRSPWMK
jgi:hypothetical protein